MVRVDVAVAAGPDEVAEAEVAAVRDHLREQRVARDVERHAEEQVGRALVELAAQLAVGHVELEQRVAGHQRHLRQVGHVPSADDQATRIGVLADLRDDVADLVDHRPIRCGPASPLLAVHRPELAGGIGPFVPDADLVLLQVADVRLALQEPQQLMHHRLPVHFLGGDERKAGREVETHLRAEHAARAGAGAVGLDGAIRHHVLQQIMVGLHHAASFESVGAACERHRNTRPIATSGRLSTMPIVSQPKAR